MAPPICRAKPDVLKHPRPDHFSFDMKAAVLNNTGQVALWREQVSSMARACGCYRELTTRFGAFPKPFTVEALVCQIRFSTCWRILADTVSGPMWAYMRALGLNRIPVFRSPDGAQWQPGPADAFYYARQAGMRFHMPRSPQQPREEMARLVEEARIATKDAYPTEEHYKKAMEWLRDVLDDRIRLGDRQVCESLYDTKPPFAPDQWRVNVLYEGPWVLRGEVVHFLPKKGASRYTQEERDNERRGKNEKELLSAEALARATIEEYRRQVKELAPVPQWQPRDARQSHPPRAGQARPSQQPQQGAQQQTQRPANTQQMHQLPQQIQQAPQGQQQQGPQPVQQTQQQAQPISQQVFQQPQQGQSAPQPEVVEIEDDDNEEEAESGEGEDGDGEEEDWDEDEVEGDQGEEEEDDDDGGDSDEE